MGAPACPGTQYENERGVHVLEQLELQGQEVSGVQQNPWLRPAMVQIQPEKLFQGLEVLAELGLVYVRNGCRLQEIIASHFESYKATALVEVKSFQFVFGDGSPIANCFSHDMRFN